MGFNNTTLIELYQVQLPFNATELKLMNQKAELYGNGYYLVSGTHDLVLLELSASTHSNASYSSTQALLITSTAADPGYMEFVVFSDAPAIPIQSEGQVRRHCPPEGNPGSCDQTHCLHHHLQQATSRP